MIKLTSSDIAREQTIDLETFAFSFTRPAKKNNLFSPNPEVLKMNHTTNLFISIYPRKIDTDDKKLVYLALLLKKREISFNEFKEYSSVLRVEDKEETIIKLILPYLVIEL